MVRLLTLLVVVVVVVAVMVLVDGVDDDDDDDDARGRSTEEPCDDWDSKGIKWGSRWVSIRSDQYSKARY